MTVVNVAKEKANQSEELKSTEVSDQPIRFSYQH